jgi:hypothetical protein
VVACLIERFWFKNFTVYRSGRISSSKEQSRRALILSILGTPGSAVYGQYFAPHLRSGCALFARFRGCAYLKTPVQILEVLLRTPAAQAVEQRLFNTRETVTDGGDAQKIHFSLACSQSSKPLFTEEKGTKRKSGIFPVVDKTVGHTTKLSSFYEYWCVSVMRRKTPKKSGRKPSQLDTLGRKSASEELLMEALI